MAKKKIGINWFFILLWPLVLLPKNFIFVVTILLILYYVLMKNIKLSKDSIPVILISLIQLVAIVVNIIFEGLYIDRTLAAINTSLLWFLGAYLIEVAKQSDSSKIGFYSTINLLILLVISAIGYLNINISIGSRTLLISDWIYDAPTFRLIAFMEYSNLIVYFILLQIYFAYNYLINKNKILVFVLLLSLFIPIYLSNSRLGIVIYLLVISLYSLDYISTLFTKNSSTLIISLSIVILLASSIFFFDFIWNSIYSLFYARSGSNSDRLKIYIESIKKVINQSPIFGVGIKHLYGAYPLGSHSTFVGILYKTGIIGALMFIYFLTYTIRKSIVTNKLLSLTFIVIIMFSILEDIDGTNWLALIFFIFVGIIFNLKNNGGNDVSSKHNYPIL